MIGAFLVGWMLVIPPSYPGYAVSVSGPYRTEEDCKAVAAAVYIASALRDLMDALPAGTQTSMTAFRPEVNGQMAGTVKAFLMAENADDLRCAQWIIERGSAMRGME